MSLKEAVEEQLDLILRLEEERKVMKRENKTLKEKIAELSTMNERKHERKVPKIDCASNTHEETPEKTEI